MTYSIFQETKRGGTRSCKAKNKLSQNMKRIMTNMVRSSQKVLYFRKAGNGSATQIFQDVYALLMGDATLSMMAAQTK